MEPRDRILAIVSKACFGSDDPCDVCGQRADAVMAVVQSALDAKDTEIAELRAAANPSNVELVRRLVHSYSRLVTTERDDARQRAEQAEAILRDLVDPDPCYFDHNGYCQAHGYSPPCAHARAHDHLAALAQPDAQTKGTT